MRSRVSELAARRLAELRGEPPPVERERPEVTAEEIAAGLAAHLPEGALERLPPEARKRLVRWADAARRGKGQPIRVGPARTSERTPKAELPLCGAPTHPWAKCPSCGEPKARAGRTCPSCGEKSTALGPPCKARVVRDDQGRPRKRCRVHGGLLTGPKTPEGRARAIANLRRGRQPGPAQRAPRNETTE